MKKGCVLMLSLLLCVGCGGNSASKVEKKEVKKFQYTPVPPMMSDRTEIANYVADHFWDSFDFTDTSFISLPKELEQAVANYIDALNRVDSAVSYRSFSTVLKKSQADTAMFRYMLDELQHYVGDPNSPMRNNLLHVNLLKSILDIPTIDTTERIAYEHQLKVNNKNMRGSKATNFKYFTRDGKKGTLYGIKTDYTIIFFNHLGCNACADVKLKLESDELITAMLRDKELTILGIFPDEDKSEWVKDKSEFAKSWINAADTDSAIERQELYHVPAIPSLYLLDKDKNVILKDVDVHDLVFVLNQITKPTV